MQNNKIKSLVVVKVAYLIALAVGYFATTLVPDLDPLWKAAVGDLAATLVIYVFSLITGNASMYDAFWSVVPIWLVAFWLFEYGFDGHDVWDWVIMALVVLWGARLTLNWYTGWTGLDHQDWRYGDLKEKTGAMYWFVNLTGIHIFPSILTFLGSLPLYAIISDSYPIAHKPIIIVAVIITFAAIVIEGISDWQRRTRYRQPEGEVYRAGLWSFSRHPNYLGEILFWVGLFIAALAHGFHFYWTGIGAVAMIILFVFISIPMMEKRQLRKDGYREYQDEVGMLLPFM